MNKLLIIGGNSFLAKNLIAVLFNHYQITAVARNFDSNNYNIIQKKITNYSNREEIEKVLSEDFRCIIFCCGMLNLSDSDLFEANVNPFATLISILNNKSLNNTPVIKVSASSITRDSSVVVGTLKQAELILKNSSLKYWAIIRPSLIYGRFDFKNLTSLAKFINHSPIIVTPRRKQVLFQPVFAEDIAVAIHRIIESHQFEKQTIEMSGPHPLDIVEAVDLIAKLHDKKILKICIDLNLIKFFVRILNALLPHGILPTEQILHLSPITPWDITTFNQILENKQTPYEKGFLTLIT